MQLGAYFGEPASDLSDWQVFYFWKLLQHERDEAAEAVLIVGECAGVLQRKR